MTAGTATDKTPAAVPAALNGTRMAGMTMAIAAQAARTPPDRLPGGRRDPGPPQPVMSDGLARTIEAARHDLERAAQHFKTGAAAKGLAALANTATDLLAAAQELRAGIEQAHQHAARHPGDTAAGYSRQGHEQAAAAARNFEACTDQLLRLVHAADPLPEFSGITRMVPPQRPSAAAGQLATRIRGTRLDLPVTALPAALPGNRPPPVSEVLTQAAACFVTGRNSEGRRTAAYAARLLAEIAERADPATTTGRTGTPGGPGRAVHPAEIAAAARNLASGPGDGTLADAVRQVATDIHASVHGQPAEHACSLLDLAASGLDRLDRSPLPAATLADAVTSLRDLAADSRRTAGRLRRDADAAAGTGHAAGSDRKARLAHDAADSFAGWAGQADQLRTACLAAITAPAAHAPAGRSTVPAPKAPPGPARTRPPARRGEPAQHSTR